jgi:TRAP-type C4-dicarboxylate transport system substrate-binding protein
LVLILLGLLANQAAIEPVTLRMSAIAPEGTGWARELRAFSRDVEMRTGSRVRIKWYFGSITGDEMATLERVRRGQLDGLAGSQVCDRLAPSLKASRVMGLLQSYEEATYVMGRLRLQLDSEFKKSGFVGWAAGLGSEIIFSNKPVRSLQDLTTLKLWLWSLDTVMVAQLRALSINVVQTPIEDTLRTLESGAADSLNTIPQAALAFRWSPRMSYFTELRTGFIMGCIAFSNRAIDSLSLADQTALRDATAKLRVRIDDLGRTTDEALLNGLFDKQGLKKVPVSDMLRAQFFAAARQVRSKVPADQVPPDLVQKIESWLADFRAERMRPR